MLLVLVLMLLVLAYQIAYKRDWTHPITFFYGIWAVCILFTVLDVYQSKIPTTPAAARVVCLGMLGFGCAAAFPFAIRLSARRPLKPRGIPLRYRSWLVYAALGISLAYNLFMAATTLDFLVRGYAYSSLRDLLFGYSGADTTFFSSTFLATFNSWISSPCTYLIASLFVLELFEHRLNICVRAAMALDIALYGFATGGRLMLLLMLGQLVLAVCYYKSRVPKQRVYRVLALAFLVVTALAAITVFRTKEDVQGAQKVNTVYAYFSINIPLLSYWIERVDEANLHGWGVAFWGGVLELITYLLGKIGIDFEHYQSVVEFLNLPQTQWIQIYNGHWYNAFLSALYSFYIDFREPGVFWGTFWFGYMSKRLWVNAVRKRNKRFLPAYLTIVQAILASFMRWQLGTLAFLVTFVLSLCCVKE